jgi:hypothetical protein
MNINFFRCRRWAGGFALLMLTCCIPARAWCAKASENLWISSLDTGIETYTAKQLKKSGMPTPTLLSTFDVVSGLAFDSSNNLWAVVNDDEVVEFTAAQLSDLATDPNPTPAVDITSATFVDLNGCNFDSQGNLWLVDGETHALEELSKAQLAAGSGEVTPAIVITSSDLGAPGFVTFDAEGNAWIDNEDFNTIVEFSVSQLSSSGDDAAAVVLSDDGSGALSDPGEIAFDKKGDLWVPNFNSNKVLKYAKTQLTSSGDPTPAVALSSTAFDGPFGAVFASNGDLVIMDFSDGTILEFTSNKLKKTGTEKPKVTVTGGTDSVAQIIFGPAS